VDGGSKDRLYLDAGWGKTAFDGVNQTYTKQKATLIVNKDVDVQFEEVPSYTISDATTAAQIKPFFTDAVEHVVINLGGIAYNQSDLSGGVIDLSGFGLEDTLKISVNDGVIKGNKQFFSAGYRPDDRENYIYQRGSTNSNISPSIRTSIDRASWQLGASVARLVSMANLRTNRGISNPPNPKVIQSGSIQIIGLPKGLPDGQFVFV
jgi:hypothetical protein